MKTLWLISKRIDDEQMTFLTRIIDPDDSIILIQDGVYLLLPEPVNLPCAIFALQPDLQARGINPIANQLSYLELVDFIFQHKKTITL